MSTKTFNDLVLSSLVEMMAPALRQKINADRVEVVRDTDARFEEQLIDANNRIDELLAENGALGEAVERMAADGQRLVEENKALAEKVERQRVALAGQTESHDRKNLRISLLMAKAAKESDAREEAEQRVAKIFSESAAMRSAHESIVMSMENQMQQMQKKIDALQQENSNHLKDLDHLSNRCAELDGRIKRAEALAQDVAPAAMDKPSVSVKGAKSALCVKGDVAMAARDGCLMTRFDAEWDSK